MLMRSHHGDTQLLRMTFDPTETHRGVKGHCANKGEPGDKANDYILYTTPKAVLLMIVSYRFKLHGLEGCGEVAVSVATQNRSKLYQLVAQHNDIDLRYTCIQCHDCS